MHGCQGPQTPLCTDGSEQAGGCEAVGALEEESVLGFGSASLLWEFMLCWVRAAALGLELFFRLVASPC